jgi:ribose-phosphate pyrophosphokinase
MIVISGSASQRLAGSLADELDVEYGKVEFKRFPDGEAYIRILTDLNNENVLLSTIFWLRSSR